MELLGIALKIGIFHMCIELKGKMKNFDRELKIIEKESNEEVYT